MAAPAPVADDFGGLAVEPAAALEPPPAPAPAMVPSHVPGAAGPAPIADDFGGVRASALVGPETATTVPPGAPSTFEAEGVTYNFPAETDTVDHRRARELLEWQDRNLVLNRERAAEALRIAAASPHPVEYVAQHLDQLRTEYPSDRVDWAGLAEQHPALSRFLLADPARFALARTDTANLKRIEWALTGKSAPVPEAERDRQADEILALEAGTTPSPTTYRVTLPFWAQIAADSVNQAEVAFRQTADYLRRATGEAPSPENTERIAELSRFVPSVRDYGIEDLHSRPLRALAQAVGFAAEMGPAVLGNVAAATGGAAAGTAAGGPAGGMAGGVLASLAFNFLQDVGPQYAGMREELRAAGKEGDPEAEEAAFFWATMGGGANAVLMTAGSGPIVAGIGRKLGMETLRDAGRQAIPRLIADQTVGTVSLRGALQFGTHWAEGVGTIVGMAGVSAASREAFRATGLGEEFRVAEVATAMEQAGRDAALGLALLSVASMPVREYVSELGRVAALDRNAARLRRAAEAARSSTTLGDAPGAGAELVRELARGTDADTFFVEKAEFDRLYQAKGVDPRAVAAEVLGDGGKAYDEAAATGADLPIPADVFLTRLARSELGLELADIARLPQDARTPRQMREEAKRVGKKIKEQADAAIAAGRKAPADEIRDDFKARAIAAGRSALEAETNAEVVARAFTWFGAQSGRDAVEVYRTEMPVTLHGQVGPRPAPRRAPAAPGAGAPARVVTPQRPGGEPARYRLVEAADLLPSHDPESFQPAKGYPEGVQERQYHSQPEEQLKVVQGAQRLDPSLVLSDTPSAVDGPPLVTAGEKPIVLGGNGRSMMILRAFKDERTRETYREALAAKAKAFGVDPAAVKKMKAPVLVREVSEVRSDAQPSELVSAVRRFNEGMTQALSPKARAVAEAKVMTPGTVEAIGSILSEGDASLREIMDARPRELVTILERDGIITDQNRSAWLAAGRLTDEAKDRLEGMFLGRVVGTGDRMAAASPAVLRKLERIAPDLLRVAGVNPGMDEIPTVQSALDVLADAQRRGMAIEDLTRQTSLLGEEGIPPEVAELAKVLAETTPKKLAERFKAWAAAAAFDPRQATMFGAPPTPEQARAALFQGATERRPQAVRADLPEASQFLTERFHALTAGERAREVYIDSNTGLLNARAFEALPPDSARPLVGHLSVEGVKWMNDAADAGGHEQGDRLYRMVARALHALVPDAAKVGGDFAVRVKDQAELDALVARLNESLPVKGFAVTGAVGEGLEAAGRAHIETKQRLEAGGARAKRGEKPLGVAEADPARVALPAERAAAEVPPALAEAHAALPDAEAFRAAYVERGTGVLTSEAWNALPRKANVAAIDMNGLKALNERLGPQGGDEALALFATLARELGGAGVDFAHLHGDEYAAQHDDAGALQAFLDRLTLVSDDVRFEVEAQDGTRYEVQGLSFGRGVGRTNVEAEAALTAHKLELADAGKRGAAADARRLRRVEGGPDAAGPAAGRPAEGAEPARREALGGGRGALPGGARAQDYAGARGAPEDVAVLAQPAFHGTPHRGIDRFSLDKIGTGEGAQAYGWGLYFAERIGVAESYRTDLSDRVLIVDGERLKRGDSDEALAAFRAYDRAAAWAKRNRADLREGWEAAKTEIDEQIATERGIVAKARDLFAAAGRWVERETAERHERVIAELRAQRTWLDATAPDQVKDEQGQTYTVDVPEKRELLDYDLPLSEQEPEVLEKLREGGVLPSEAEVARFRAAIEARDANVLDVRKPRESAAQNLLGALDGLEEGGGQGVPRPLPEALAEIRRFLTRSRDEMRSEVEKRGGAAVDYARKDLASYDEMLAFLDEVEADPSKLAPFRERYDRANAAIADLNDLERRWGALLSTTSDHDVMQWTGGQLYQALEETLRSPREVSERLLDAGLPGLKYADGGSRRATQTALFDGKPIDSSSFEGLSPAHSDALNAIHNVVSRPPPNRGKLWTRDAVRAAAFGWGGEQPSEGWKQAVREVAERLTFKREEPSRNFVIWDEGRISITGTLYQRHVRLPEGGRVGIRGKRARGTERGFFQVQFDAGGRPVKGEIHLADPDRSTLPHETMHWFTDVLGRLAEAPEPGGAATPLPKPGTVRLYHGGVPGAGPRWVTPDLEYARGYASKSKGGVVEYVDLPETSPLLRKAFDDEGTGQKAPVLPFEAPAEIARALKPFRSESSPGSSELRSAYQTLLRAMGYADGRERLEAARERRQLQAKDRLSPAEATRLKTLVAKEEKVTHMWEQFLAEGRAPSRELLPIFARFKSWLGRIYGAAEGVADQYRQTYGEDLGLTDEVRAVFRRMLAGDEAVADAARELDAEGPRVALTPDEQAESDRLRAEARALAELELQRLLIEEDRAADRDHMKAERARLTAEVNAELDQDPTYAAIAALRRGDVDGMPAKLDRASVVAAFGKDVAKALPEGVLADEGGVPPDAIAPLLRFRSGEDLVGALVGAEERERLVARQVRQRLADLYPALQDRPRLLRDAARGALHNDALLRDGIIRARALAREAGIEPGITDLATLKAAADDVARGTKLSDIRPDRWDLAARSWARRASEAASPAARKDAFEAYLFNRALYHAALEAKGQAEKDVRALGIYTKPPARAKLGKATEVGPDGALRQPFLEKADELLAAYEFRASATLKDVHSRAAQRAELERWVQERWAAGDSVVIPPSVLETLGRTTHWKDLTPAQLADLRAAVDSIAHQADLRTKFVVGGKKVDAERVVAELVGRTLQAKGGEPQRLATNTATLGERLKSAGRQVVHMVERPEVLLRGLDGGDQNGPWKTYVWDPISDASYRFHDLVRRTSRGIQDMLHALPAAERARIHETRFVVEGHEYTSENVIAVLLNVGNEGNLTKLVRGMSDERLRLFGVEPWNGRTTLDRILEHATAKDVELAQKILDEVESYWPEAERLEIEDVGLAPKKVQARPFSFVGAGGERLTLERGGYYPIIYSSKLPVGKRQVETDVSNALGLPGLFNPAYDAASTPQGYLQARIDNYARPFDLTLDALPRKLVGTSKDIAFRLTAKQVYRVLTDDRVVGAVTQKIGERGYNVVLGHLKDAVNDVTLPDAGAGIALRAMNWLRARTTESIFSLNVPQTLQNLADGVGANAVVPVRAYRDATLRLLGDWKGTIERVNGLSAEMRIRADGRSSSVAHALEDTFRKSDLAIGWEHAKDAMMAPFETTIAVIEYGVWDAAFETARKPEAEGGLGLEHDAARAAEDPAYTSPAVRHANDAVRAMFGGKRTVDLPPIMRDKVLRWFTMFGGWTNTQINLFIRATQDSGRHWTAGRRAKAMKVLAHAYALLVVKNLVSEVLVGNGPDDRDQDGKVDAAEVGKWVAWKGVTTLPGWAPVISSTMRAADDKGGRDVSMTPWLTAFNALAKTWRASRSAAEDAVDTGEVDDDKAIAALMAWLEASGTLAGAPVTQPRNTTRYWMDPDRNRGAGPFEDVLGTAYGPKRPGKLSTAIYGP